VEQMIVFHFIQYISSFTEVSLPIFPVFRGNLPQYWYLDNRQLLVEMDILSLFSLLFSQQAFKDYCSYPLSGQIIAKVHSS
jgi:hypothetical protein